MKVNKVFKLLTFSGLSIQQRLPILICLLLCSIILTFSFTSYFGVRNVAIKMGENRIRTLTDQLGVMFVRSSGVLIKRMDQFAQNDTIKTFLSSGGTKYYRETELILKRIQKDSTWVLVEMLDSLRKPIIKSGNIKAGEKLGLNTIFSDVGDKADTTVIGNAFAINDTTIYYPVLTKIIKEGKLLGHIVAWKSLTSNQQSINELSRILGTGAILYIGNTDGSLWTNLLNPVNAPPVNLNQADKIFKYTNNKGEKVIAAVYPISKTPWWLLIEFSEVTMLEPVLSYINWILPAGLILILAGIFFTWLMSRNIIKPIDQLTKAAIALTDQEYTEHVVVNRIDELGKLAQAFNKMADQISLTRTEMENKVIERTSQLQAAISELEAFSYSVSHDLRSPLRAINGYSKILSADWAHQLDADGLKYLNSIQKNSAKMGELIDELLTFSRLGRMEINRSEINMNALVNNIIEEEAQGFENTKLIVHELPMAIASNPMIRQVWSNLISNALKFSRTRDKPEIEIGSEVRDDQQIYYIKDNGAGFNMDYYDKLFGVFQRLHSNKEFEGTGIGLALVERIIHRHNGKIWATSKVNEGTIFYFSLPDY